MSIFTKLIKRIREASAPVDPSSCKHTWSRQYDYTTYSGAVRVVESYCTKCKTPSSGGGQ